MQTYRLFNIINGQAQGGQPRSMKIAGRGTRSVTAPSSVGPPAAEPYRAVPSAYRIRRSMLDVRCSMFNFFDFFSCSH